jgi:hypothetical protein
MGNPNSRKENPAHGLCGDSKDDLAVGSVNSENSRKDLTQAGIDYVLAKMRVASLRLRLPLNEIDAVGLAVKAGLMSADAAIEHLDEIGAPLSLVDAPSERSV